MCWERECYILKGKKTNKILLKLLHIRAWKRFYGIFLSFLTLQMIIVLHFSMLGVVTFLQKVTLKVTLLYEMWFIRCLEWYFLRNEKYRSARDCYRSLATLSKKENWYHHKIAPHKIYMGCTWSHKISLRSRWKILPVGLAIGISMRWKVHWKCYAPAFYEPCEAFSCH